MSQFSRSSAEDARGEHAYKTLALSTDLELRILAAALFVSDLDPFELFKDPKSRALIQRKLGVESSSSTAAGDDFCLRRSERDRLRSRIARYSGIFHTYLLLKGFFASVAKFLLLRHELYEALAASENNDLRRAETKLMRPALDVSFSRAALNFIGNPLAVLGDQYFYLYIGMTGLAFVRLAIIAPFFHSAKHKLDMAYLRFLLAPDFEQRRIDARVRLKLSDLERTITCNASNQIRLTESGGGGGGCSSTHDYWKRGEPSFIQRRLDVQLFGSATSFGGGGTAQRFANLAQPGENYAKLARLVQALRHPCEAASLRPRIFQPDFLPHIRLQTRAIAFGIYATVAISSIAHVVLVVYLNYASNRDCQVALKSTTGGGGGGGGGGGVAGSDNLGDKCHSLTYSDILFGLELLICMLCCAAFESAHTILNNVNIVTHMQLINSMRDELDACQVELTKHYLEGCGKACNKTRSLSASELDKLLLRQIARLSVFEGELKDGFQTLSNQVVQYLYHIGMLSLILLVTGDFQALASPRIRNATLAIVWLWLNVIALLCCAINTRFSKLEKRHWSILAQITRVQVACDGDTCTRPPVNSNIEDDDDWSFQQQTRKQLRVLPVTGGTWTSGSSSSMAASPVDISTLDILKDIWRKFAIATSSNIEQYCVRPLGIPLTYRRVIKLNFTAIFIYSLALNSSSSSGSFNNIIR